MSKPAPSRDDDPRTRRVLDAALATFLRYGFRKTSMDEVARAAGLSRQGLYLHYPTKEALFHAALHHALDQGLAAASAKLRAAHASIEERLVGAFDEWVGRYAGSMTGDVADLHEAVEAHGQDEMSLREAEFLDEVTKVVRGEGLAAAYKPAGLSARQLTETLHATARGLKEGCASRTDFADRFRIAVRALCLPLKARE